MLRRQETVRFDHAVSGKGSMGESEGRSAGKTAGILASVIAVVTLAGALGKDAYDRYVSGKDKGDERRTSRRQSLSRVSHLGMLMGDTHVILLSRALLARPLPSDADSLEGLSVSGKAVLNDLGLGDHYRNVTSVQGFQAYDKDINLTVRDKLGERAWSLYQLQELSEESCAALSLGNGGSDPKLREQWLKAWSPNWKNYAGWLKNDLGTLGLKFDVSMTIDPNDPMATVSRFREMQGLVQRAIDGDAIPE